MFAIVLRMTESWLSAPPALQAVAGQDPLSRGRVRQHRKALVEAVRTGKAGGLLPTMSAGLCARIPG